MGSFDEATNISNYGKWISKKSCSHSPSIVSLPAKQLYLAVAGKPTQLPWVRLKSIYIYITKGSLLAGYLEFYFAKQRGGLDPLSLNDQEKGTPLPPSKGTLAICLVSLFTQQPLRSVSSSSPSSSSTSSSSSSPSSFDLKFGFFDIHFPSTQRCDESDRFEHP